MRGRCRFLEAETAEIPSALNRGFHRVAQRRFGKLLWLIEITECRPSVYLFGYEVS